jgi:hypothetical protein
MVGDPKVHLPSQQCAPISLPGTFYARSSKEYSCGALRYIFEPAWFIAHCLRASLVRHRRVKKLKSRKAIVDARYRAMRNVSVLGDEDRAMAGRKWKDINELWLERYLEKAGLWPLWADDPEGAEIYEDHPFAWQASWVLSDAQWSRLRSTWEHQVQQGSTTANTLQEEQSAEDKLREACWRIEKLTEQNKAMAMELETLRRQG